MNIKHLNLILGIFCIVCGVIDLTNGNLLEGGFCIVLGLANLAMELK